MSKKNVYHRLVLSNANSMTSIVVSVIMDGSDLRYMIRSHSMDMLSKLNSPQQVFDAKKNSTLSILILMPLFRIRFKITLLFASIIHYYYSLEDIWKLFIQFCLKYVY